MKNADLMFGHLASCHLLFEHGEFLILHISFLTFLTDHTCIAKTMTITPITTNL